MELHPLQITSIGYQCFFNRQFKIIRFPTIDSFHPGKRWMKTDLVACDDPRYTPFSVDPKEIHGEESNILTGDENEVKKFSIRDL